MPETDGLTVDNPPAPPPPPAGGYEASRAKLAALRDRLAWAEAVVVLARLRRAGLTLRVTAAGALMVGPEPRLTPWCRGLIGRYRDELAMLVTAETT